MIRIVIADDHPLLRSGVRLELSEEKDFEVIGEEGDGEAALARIVKLKPDVAVLDIEMPGMTGIEVTRSLAAEGSRTAVVVLSIHPDESFVRSAVEAGVSGYVVKQDAARDLVQAVRAASRGEVFISPRVAGPLIGSLRGGGQDAQRPPLSPRERDVVRLLARGLSSKQIAGELRLSPKTVEGYRTAIMDKLDIHSIAGLVKYAIREHLAGLEE